MNRTVAYQETPNNYTDSRQNIKGAQIATIKNFGVAPPAGGGDFIGQLGISADANGEALLYVYSVGGLWQLVGSSGDANMPDTVVQENLKNNFTEVDQRIEDCQITYIDSGTRVPDHVAIKGQGHIYVYETNPAQLYMSFDGSTWTQLRTGADVNNNVELDKANDFVNANQTILGSAIVNVKKSSMTPTIDPIREGELYIQLAEGTPDRKARMWISNNTGGGWKWEPLTHIYDLPSTVVQTSKINNFEATEQTIAGNQILTFIDGGDKNPGQTGARPDFDGQFYIATHTNTSGIRDVAIWVADGNAWLPVREDIELGTIVRTDKANRFSVTEQILGEGGGNARWLAGNRVKFSGNAPVADSNWKVQNIGEITVYTNDSVIPNETSVWMGVSKNANPDSNNGEWVMIWSSKQGEVDNYARTDKSNTFAPMQYITNGAKRHLINVGHEGGAGSPKSTLVPMAPGDTYTQSYSHPSLGETRNIWVAAIEGDTESWKRLLSEDDKDVILATRKNHFLTRDNFLGTESDTKRDRVMGSRNHESSTTGIIGISPTMFGEVVVTKKYDPNHPSDKDYMIVEAHLAVGTGRKSWIKIGEAVAKDLELIDDGTNN